MMNLYKGYSSKYMDLQGSESDMFQWMSLKIQSGVANTLGTEPIHYLREYTNNLHMLDMNQIECN
jgi:hypothetical protein